MEEVSLTVVVVEVSIAQLVIGSCRMIPYVRRIHVHDGYLRRRSDNNARNAQNVMEKNDVMNVHYCVECNRCGVENVWRTHI